MRGVVLLQMDKLRKISVRSFALKFFGYFRWAKY